jgi:hypothetical protein
METLTEPLRLVQPVEPPEPPPLAPLQCAMSKKTLARLPRGFNLHIEENPDCFVFTVQTKEPLIKVAGVFPKP